jgi:hypothetical protein
MLTAQMGQLPGVDFSKFDLRNIDFSNIGNLSQQINAELFKIGLPEVDIVSSFMKGGPEQVKKDLATAAAQTSTFKDLLTTMQENIKKISETKAGQFVVRYWPYITIGTIVLVFLAFRKRGGSRPFTTAGAMANSRRRKSKRGHRKSKR